ncbi:copper-translocating P-type ATPase [Photobacterium lutimaris]|uniref:Copper-exporting P-type ATPase n=1 Tax=Photobacterium lutimaris TaxID=388278 RepID=A0A2T3IV17_9GAMM|nr:copper-translocating P-type ATPase [Photobacterium lutimaris]PSU32243.1 copper-translocating P-type ATPase [Photobacterium lutimaris]TDR73113.1 Cu+-exporting ATPase [Photobacterium lutimaris]
MVELTLPLRKVRCMNCANKIKSALTELPGIESVDVNTEHAILQGTFVPEAAIAIITELGYEAGYQYQLPLAGLSCCKCVRKVKDALDSHPEIFSADVSKTELSATGSLPEPQLIELIESLGFSVPQAEAEQPASRHYELSLSGLSCGKCVAKVENLLEQHPDVTEFTVSKTHASMQTTLDQDAAITLIESAGFGASPVAEKANASELLADNAVAVQASGKAPERSHTTTRKPQDGVTSQQFILSGMTCASCVSSVEKAIISVDGVISTSVNLAERTALVSGRADSHRIIQAIEDAGYQAELSEDELTRRQRQQTQNEQVYRQHIKNAYIALAVGGPLMAWGVFGGSMMITSQADQLGWGAIGLITLLLLATVGKHFFTNAWKAFKHHRATMDTLVALGTGAAWLYSMLVVLVPDWLPMQARHVYFEASAMILGLITLGHALEARARSRTSKALEQLMDLQPQTAIIVDNGEEREVPLADVHTGMVLRLHPGAKVPVDGTILEGQSYIDESMLTGEPIPANKKAGDTLHAGTINQHGSLLFTAERIGRDTMLARIIDLVRQAQSSKPALARLADSISAIFVPAVMIIAIVTAMLWYYFGPDPSSVYMLVTATTVLIIACPCALGLATPMSVTVGVGRAAEYGVLIRNAEALQIAADIDTVVLDKTGTLTEGKPALVDSECYNGFNKGQLLTLAASLEQGSEHPLATAIVNAAKADALNLEPQQHFLAQPGFGISGEVLGHSVQLGNQKLMALHQIDLLPAQQAALHASEQGATPIYVAVDGQLAGLLAVSDPIRHDSVAAIKRMKRMGLEVIMLTGDIPATANAIAKQAGIEHVIAGVLPDGKASEVEKIQQQGKRIAMVGDGINDAPALAQADIGIAMGSGSDVAIESAQLTLVRHSLHGVPDALQLSKATLRNMKQNLFGAFVYNTLGIPVAAGILFPFTGALLSPVVAGAAMALSSITVVSNANRLRLFKPDSKYKQATQPHSQPKTER